MATVNPVPSRLREQVSKHSYWLNVAAGLVVALAWFVICINEVAR